jgi:hypothetical protein
MGVGFSLSAVALLLLLAAVTKYVNSPAATSAGSSMEARTGKIMIESVRGEVCEERKFDNGTGRISGIGAPCRTPDVDDNGRPIVRGTAGRLDAIGKSFLNR